MRTAVVSAAMAAIVAIMLAIGAGDPDSWNSYIVIGIANGAVFGLVALGLVLVYKGSRVFNFAAGEFGTVAAFILYVLIEQVKSPEIPYGVAALIAIAGAVVMGLGLERVIVRPLLNAPRITLLVATIAFALLAIGVEIVLFLPEAKALPPAIPTTDAQGNPQGLEIFGFILEPQRLLVLGLLAVIAVGLAYFFSKTDLGLAVLATSQDPFATRVVGIGVERMSRFIWGSAAFLGALAGILYVPIAGALAPGVVTSGVLIPSFTAAVIGGMTSLPGAFVGGIFVGIITQLGEWASGRYEVGGDLLQLTVPGFSFIVLVAALLIVLLVRPQGLLGTEA
jgi:branched-chain amino acid transport system permease protein